MRMILLLALLGAGPVLGAACFKRRFEELLAPSFGLIVLLLYGFYMVNQLKAGLFAVITVLCLCYMVAAIYLVKRKTIKSFAKNFFTPGFVIALLVLAGCWIATNTAEVLLWDEMRLWGAVPKAMFYSDQLQLGPNAIIYPNMQSYYPGIQLFQYFCEKVRTASFQENLLFFAYTLFGGAMLISCARDMQWKKAWQIPIVALIVLLLPLAFYNSDFNYANYYLSLYIDPMLGIAFAYSLYLIWDMREPDMFTGISYILSLTTLVLLKDSGLLLALFSVITLGVVYGWKNLKQNRQYRTLLAGSVITMVITAVAWKMCLFAAQIQNHIKAPTGGIINFLISPTQEQLLIAKEYWLHWVPLQILTRPAFWEWWNQTPGKVRPSWLILMVLFVAFAIALWFVAQKNKQFLKLIVCLLTWNVVYLLSMFVLYIGSMGGIESYERYEGTLMLATLTLLAMITIGLFQMKSEKINREILAPSAALGICVCILTFPLKAPSMPTFLEDAKVLGQQNANSIVAQIAGGGGIERPRNVFLLQDGGDPLVHHRTYLDLIEKNIYIKNFYSAVDPKAMGLEEPVEWLQYLEENEFEYVYLENLGNEFAEHYQDCFAQKPEAGRLYRLENGMLIPV